VSAAALFPLNDGDVYHYDTGLVLTVERTTTEPNLGSVEVAKLTFTLGGRTFGFYLDDLQNPLAKAGEFDLQGEQVVFTTPMLLIAPRDNVGVVRPVVGPITGYAPYGSTTPTYQRTAETVTEIAQRADIRTSLGGFHAVRVPITTTQLPAYGSTFVEL